MPIPGLKVQSPQNWKKPRKYKIRTSFGKKVVYLKRRKISWPKKILKWGITILILLIILLGVFGTFTLAWFSKNLPDPNRLIQRAIPLSTKIYDRTGETLLYDIHGQEKRTMIELSEIPDYLKWATIVAEDRRFYEHKGFSLKSIIRAFLVNFLQRGKIQGASTLTQQLVKNAILTPEKTYTRKIKEIILSYQIEEKFSKDEILKMYFNEIPYGSTAYGVEAAAQTYFGKSVKDLTLAEAAALAALPKAPTYYSPYGSHKEELIVRQYWILDNMVKEGYISQNQAEEAKKQKLEFKLLKVRESIIAPHFVMDVKEYLTQKYGERVVEQGGLKVITTLDLYKQKIAEEVIKELVEKNLTWKAANTSLVALDPKTGQILVMVGSKDYFAEPYPAGCDPGKNCLFDPSVNVTTRPRQPGSSFKPVVYAAAFRKGYTPETVLYDVVTKFINYDKKDYEPHNYDLKEHGPVTMYQALAGSLNIPAVKTIYLTGIDQVLDLAENLGYTTLKDRSRFGLSLVLGGGEVKLIEHTNAYAVFAREGEWHPISTVLKVEDKDGKVLEEFKNQEKKVLETQVARQINSILSDNPARAFIFGEQNYLNLGQRPVAAKTGTTNDYRDAWTIGYTPSIVTGVWVGNNDNSEMKKGADGSVVAAPIWHEFMKRVLGDIPIEYFKEPEPTQTDKPVLNGTITEGIKVKIDKASTKLATNLTPESNVLEKTYKQVHSILHYIDKDDPQGPHSKEPEKDPQYQRWEEAVQRWAKEQGITAEEPPTEYDDLHTLANQPTLEILSPQNNQTLTDRQLKVEIQVSAPRGVGRVDYFLNDKLIKAVYDPSFNLDIYLDDPEIGNGYYTLKVKALDDIDNSKTQQIDLNLLFTSLPPEFSWLSPPANQIYSTSDFPLDLIAEISRPENIQKIILYFQEPNESPQYITEVRQFPENQLKTKWLDPPEAGNYQVYGIITNQTGSSYETERVSISLE